MLTVFEPFSMFALVPQTKEGEPEASASLMLFMLAQKSVPLCHVFLDAIVLGNLRMHRQINCRAQINCCSWTPFDGVSIMSEPLMHLKPNLIPSLDKVQVLQVVEVSNGLHPAACSLMLWR